VTGAADFKLWHAVTTSHLEASDLEVATIAQVTSLQEMR
jgi:hypothetical protein